MRHMRSSAHNVVMRLVALFSVASPLLVAPACGPVALTPIPCYSGPTPMDPALWECFASRSCSFECSDPDGEIFIVAAPDSAIATQCLRDILANGNPAAWWRVSCWSYDAGPGGDPNAAELDESPVGTPLNGAASSTLENRSGR